MRFTLFIISVLFSYIFYEFYIFSSWKNIFSEKLLNPTQLETLTWNLLLETFLFLIFWVLFVIYFSPLKKEKINNNKTFYILFYLIFLFLFFFKIYYLDNFIIFAILFFLFWDLSFNFLSKLEFFTEQKKNLRYFWLVLNYISSLVSIFYILNIRFSIFLFLILIFSMFFNFFIHKKYTNYVSLFLSIWILIFLLYFFIFKILYSLIIL